LNPRPADRGLALQCVEQPTFDAGAATGPTCDGVSHQTTAPVQSATPSFAKGQTVDVLVTLHNTTGNLIDAKVEEVTL
jgi:hypothetical protein